MQTKTAKPKKRGFIMMLTAFFVLVVGMFTAPFVEQKRKDSNPEIRTQKAVVHGTSPLKAVAMFGLVTCAGLAALAAPVAADINWTDIDAMFAGLTEHLIPDITQVVSASTSLIITIVVVIVVIAVAMFFPELLYEILDSLKSAMRFRR